MKITIEKKGEKKEFTVHSDNVGMILEVFIAGLTSVGYDYKDIVKAIVKTGKNYQKYL